MTRDDGAAVQQSEAEALVASLQGRGFSLEIAGGRLLVRPPGCLTEEERGKVQRLKREIMDTLPQPGTPGTPGNPAQDPCLSTPPSDAVLDAIAERAWTDPPDFDSAPVVERASVILDVFGRLVAADPQALAQIAEHNARARQRWEEQLARQDLARLKAKEAKEKPAPNEQPGLF
jgi:hypothetical protein